MKSSVGEGRRDPTPKKVLYAKSAPMSDRSWRGSRLSSGLDPRDPTPGKVLFVKSALMSDRHGAGQDFLRGWIPLKGPRETTAAGQ